jgi:hypothetical protein
VTAGSQTFEFAYVSVSGCTEGGLVSFVAGTPPPVGTVGTIPILVLVVYVPVGGPGGNGDSGAVIDAFNVTTGSLVDNDFVAVTPDPGGTLTGEANVDGWVDTETSGYTITADHPNIGPYMALPTNAVFDQWVDLTNPSPPGSLISGANLTPAQGATVYALAFYSNPAVKIVKEFKEVYQDKSLKEHIKEVDKTPFKDHIAEIPYKTVTSEGPGKGAKESVENPGGLGPGGDPGGTVGELGRLSQRVSRLEASLKESQKGKAFIKAEDRPPVGKAKTRKTRDH